MIAPVERAMAVEVDQRVRIAAPPERVWRALTDVADLRRWLFASAEADVREGGSWRFTFPHWPSARGLHHPALNFGGPIVELVPGRVLAVQFEPPYWGILRFELSPDGDATDLRVTQRGFEGNEEWLADFRGGWGSFSDRLALLCEIGQVATARRLEGGVARRLEPGELAGALRVAIDPSDGYALALPYRPAVDLGDPEPFVRAFERSFCAPGRAAAPTYFTRGGAFALAGGPHPRPLDTPLSRLPEQAVARFWRLRLDGDGVLTADWEGSGWTAGRNRGTSTWTFADDGRIARLILRFDPSVERMVAA